MNNDGFAIRGLADGSSDRLCREEPLVLQVGEQQLLTMRTPGADLQLAVGFLLSEGVVDDVAAITDHRFLPGEPTQLRADTLLVHVSGAATSKASGRLTRTHEIRSSCGICGLTDASALLEETTPLRPGRPRVARDDLQRWRQIFERRQPLFAATGGAHGAMLFAANGAVLGHGEDIGRHNALDKAIGMAALAGHDVRSAIAMLSGRAGADLVFKCLRLGIGVILSVSAASALSHDLCETAGATLIGFLRPDGMKVYCDNGRIST